MPAQLGLFTGIALAVGVFVFFLTNQMAMGVECITYLDTDNGLRLCDQEGYLGIFPASSAPGWYAGIAALVTFIGGLIYKASQNKPS